MSEVQVSVIMPARNEATMIDRALDSILGQKGVSLEVIVVDNGSRDGTGDLVRARAAVDPRVVLLEVSEPSIPRSLNTALAAARGRWLVRVDAHSTISDGYLARAVERLSEGRWSGVGGRKAAVADTTVGQSIAAVLNSRFAVGGSLYHWGTKEQAVDHIPFGCYETARVRALGGWDEHIPNNEDFEFDQRLRATGPLLFDPAMSIDWHARESVGALFRQYRRYGRGKPLVAVRHPGSLRPRHLAPPLLVLWLVGGAVWGVRRPMAAVADVGLYGAGIAALTMLVVRESPRGSSRAAIPPALVAMQVGWGLGFWQGVGDVVVSRLLGTRVGGGLPRTRRAGRKDS